MKKRFLLLITLMALASCGGSSSSLSESSSSEESLSSSVPNGLVPLVPYENCEVPTLEGGWVARWADEFDGETLDKTKWNVEVNGDGGGNQELQYYREENIAVADGNLSITAKKEAYLGKQYTSGRINTKYRMEVRYGRVQARVKLPGGRGTWAAFWMMPLFNLYGTWPKSGELDIMEYVGYNDDTIYGTIHTEKFNSLLGSQRQGTKTVETAEEDYHIYETIWGPGAISLLVDGVQYFQFGYTPQFNQEVKYSAAFPFDQEFFAILNVAIGGTWGGSQGVDDTIFPVVMSVDFVRVYGMDYAVLDQTPPTVPTTLAQATLKNTFHWVKSTDDYGVEQYAVYVDGTFLKYVNLNQCTLTSLTPNQTYSIQVKAIDFVGRESALSDPLSLTYVS